jgi:predicted house-cleaning noncanonical NTP pyrophosphatase (MazG superfamily)
MKIKKHNKLVRDKIIQILAIKGIECEYRTASINEMYELLLRKLDEEIIEFKASRNLEELADIYEVILTLSVYIGHSPNELETARESKALERGGFDLGIVLETTTE